jgi:hypothetical protein
VYVIWGCWIKVVAVARPIAPGRITNWVVMVVEFVVKDGRCCWVSGALAGDWDRASASGKCVLKERQLNGHGAPMLPGMCSWQYPCSLALPVRQRCQDDTVGADVRR